MKKGKIVEDGNHQTLLRDYKDGVYAKLVAEQKNVESDEEEEMKFDGKAEQDKNRQKEQLESAAEFNINDESSI